MLSLPPPSSDEMECIERRNGLVEVAFTNTADALAVPIADRRNSSSWSEASARRWIELLREDGPEGGLLRMGEVARMSLLEVLVAPIDADGPTPPRPPPP
jgi:hypothetical protein